MVEVKFAKYRRKCKTCGSIILNRNGHASYCKDCSLVVRDVQDSFTKFRTKIGKEYAGRYKLSYGLNFIKIRKIRCQK